MFCVNKNGFSYFSATGAPPASTKKETGGKKAAKPAKGGEE